MIINKKAIYCICLIFLCFTALISLIRAKHNAFENSGDLYLRINETKAIINGEDIYSQSILSNYHDKYIPQYFPSALLCYIPLAFIALNFAKISWFITSNLFFLVFVICLYFLAFPKRIKLKYYIMAVLILISSTPFRVTYEVGQSSIVALSFLIAALVCSKYRKNFSAGILLSFSLIKYSMVIPFIFFFFILEKKWLTLFVCLLFHLVIHTWLCFLMNASPVQNILNLIPLNLHMIRSFPGVDFFSVLKTLFLKNYYTNILIFFLPLVLSLGLFSYMIVLRYICKKTYNLFDWLGLVSIFGMLIVYHRIYDAVSLFPCLIMVFINININKSLRIFSILILSGAGYFFFFERIFKLFPIQESIYNLLTQFLGHFALLCMFFSAARIIYLKSKIKSSH